MKPEFEWLKECALNVYSQSGEDGVLDAIFQVIGTENKWCFECGAADGIFFSNTRRFITRGWNGILVEADEGLFERLQDNNADFGPRVILSKSRIGDDFPLEQCLRQAGAPVDIDLVVIDIDGQDYYLFNSLFRYRPRVVVVEFSLKNGSDKFIPDLNAAGQAGLGAILQLGAGKMYTPVFQSFTNIIFVRQPLDRILEGTRERFLGPTAKQ